MDNCLICGLPAVSRVISEATKEDGEKILLGVDYCTTHAASVRERLEENGQSVSVLPIERKHG